MKLIVNTSDFPERLGGMKRAIDLIADAGFDGIDFSAASSEEFYTEGAHPISYYTDIRSYAEAKGLAFLQAHAPHGSSFADETKTEKRFREIVCSMRNASLLGVENIVVHPCQHLTYREPGVPEQLFEINMAFFRRLLPYAEEYGIRVCTENMFQGDMHILNVHSTCSRPDEMIRYFDEINHPLFGCCLDIGHTSVVREDAANFIRALGKKRLTCLHVHDVDEVHDRHTVPYFGGAIAWDRVMAALAEIGYAGDFTYETDYVYASRPIELAPAIARLSAAIGRGLIAKFDLLAH
jgi:sugar phosphate isomerase/epimerase